MQGGIKSQMKLVHEIKVYLHPVYFKTNRDSSIERHVWSQGLPVLSSHQRSGVVSGRGDGVGKGCVVTEGFAEKE